MTFKEYYDFLYPQYNGEWAVWHELLTDVNTRVLNTMSSFIDHKLEEKFKEKETE